MDTPRFNSEHSVYRSLFFHFVIVFLCYVLVIQQLKADTSGYISDDFNTNSLNTSLWTFVDPIGDGNLVVNGTQLMLSVPSGVSHDIWSSGNDSVRVMQTIADVDFQLEIKFESDITEQYQIQGIVIEQDNSNFIRFDFYSDGTNTKIFAATVAGGSASSKVNTTISSYSPLTMRVTRSINDWTVEYSLDGNIWITAGIFSHILTVTGAGPFVANDGNSNIPSHTAIIDYIFNTASIIDPEDGVLENDTESPFIRDIRKVAANDHFEVLWQTDEVATGSIDYGVTTAYELGTIEHTTFDLDHHLIVPGLNTGTTYQFQLRSNDISGNENVSNNFQLNVSDNPFIDSWYGSLLNFGQLGSNSAHWINILGNVSGENTLDSFRYALNGGSTVPLQTGPDGKRLQYDGDFNADIEYLEFNDGINTLDIIAQDILGNQTTESITINYSENNNWPLPYSIDWQTVSNIEDVAQIVDGQWLLTNEGIRSAQLGYDRLLSIGDINWDNYEVTVPVTVHGMDAVCTSDLQNDPCNGGAAVGVLVRWQGHHSSSSQPNSNWVPLGALGWYRWKYSLSTQTHSPGLYLTGGDGSTILSDESASLPSGVKHILKVRAETVSGQHEYKVKMWEESDPEPNSWDLEGTQTLAESFGNGSILLLTHYMDVTFGNVEVTSLNGADTTPPVISNLQSTTTATSATITWNTNEASDSMVNYGLDSSYGSNNTNATLVTSHSLTLSGLVSDTVYHYQASSTDGSGNTASSVDLTFTTSSPGEGSPSGLISDDFNSGSLNSAWSIYDPLGDSTFSLTGTELSISVPAGTSHDLWTDGRLSPRVLQQTNNTDFELEVKFNSAVTQQYQMQGITVEQDDDNLLRFDFYYDGSQTRIYSASFVDGVATKRIKETIPDGVPLYLRVNRTGDLWIEYYSYDGIIWTEAGRYTHALTVTATSVFGGNAGNSAPAHNVLVDYFTVDGLPPDTGEDTTPPVISNVQVAVTNSAATITWDTDEASNSTVNYGLDSSYGQTEGTVVLVTSHSITLSGLTTGTEYNYQVTSGDSAGNVTSSSNLTFATTNTSGLLAYWPMDEGTGTSIIDMTGNGNTGTLTNGPLWVSGAGLNFDGVDDYVDLGAMDVSGSEISISAWVYADNIANCSSKDCRIISKATGTGTQDHYFMVSTIQSNGVNRLRFRLKTDGTTSTLIASSGVITENEWFHIVAVYDGSTMKLFLNGLEVGSKSRTGTLSTNNNVSTWLGGTPPSATGRPWDGQIDNLRIYDRALSTVEINDLYNDLSTPVISNVQVISTNVDATVTWDTSKPADSNLEYGLDSSYGTVINETSLVTSHSITMTNLTANTTYYYQFSSTDSNSNTASSGGLTLTTTSGPDVTPPVISNVQVAQTNTTATITWDTDEVSDSTVNYGLDSSYGQTEGAVTLVTSHSITLSGLTAGTVYNYQVTSGDNAGNVASSSNLTFTTTNTSGLLAYWPMDEGTGTSIIDMTGNGNTGTLTNGPLWVTGAGLDFDGIDDYVDLGPMDVSGSEISISAWVYADNIANCSSKDCRIISKATGTGTQDHYYMVSTIQSNGVNRLRFRLKTDGTTSTLFSSSGVITENEWFHVVAVYDGSAMKLFLNGLEIGSKSITGTLSTNSNVSTWLGGNPPNATGRPWDGQIDNLRIYDRALSTVEINDLYNNLSIPVISNIQIISTDVDATVTWNTSKPADSNLEYGLDASYGTVINEASLVTSHSITMTNLTANTTYYYQFSSTDSSSNTESSGDFTFTTTSGPDETPPVISNVQVVVTNTTATITWDTDEVSDSTVNYGLNSSYGSNTTDAGLVTSHSLSLNGLTSDTEYHYQASSTDGSSNTALSSDLTFTTDTSGAGSPSGLISDDFNTGSLDSAWSIYDPIGDSSFSFTGTELSIAVPAGTSHDLWTNGRFSPRVRQLANNTDFELDVKFNSTVNQQYQIQGMTVEQNDDNLLRFDFHYDGAQTRIYSASFVGGVATKRIRKTIPDGAPLYLRVNRTGDLWIISYSYDGSIWSEAGRYTHVLTVTSTSVFGGNAGNSAPAHNVLVDYFTVDGLPPNGAP